jgi:hypothetical protein
MERHMKIENRVEALEVELKILKSEIQVTLLEIREQVLNHYYPELRAEEPSRPTLAAKSSDPRSRTRTAADFSPSAPAPTPPFSDLFLQDIADEELDEPAPEPIGARKGYVMGHVSLSAADAADDTVDDAADDLEPAPPPRGKPTPVAAPVAAPVALEAKHVKSNRRLFAALAGWVGDSIAKVGKERTLQVMETYATGSGGLAPDLRTTLTQLVALADDEGPKQPVSNQDMLGLLVQLDEILGDA